MDAVGTVLSLSQTLLAALQCSELKDLWSIVGYKSKLKNLERTVDTIKSVLLDAESQQGMGLVLSHQHQLWIEELKDVVYDIDDLLDEFVTLAEQNQQTKGGNFSIKVRFYISKFCFLITARSISQRVKEIRNKLDAIVGNHNQFGFKFDLEPIRRRSEETCSYVNAHKIIGREDDMEKILAKVLDTHVQKDVSFFSIVGIGGLGKTALAQLLYNHPRITKEFPFRIWTCVADHDKNGLDVKGVLVEILESVTGKKCEDLSMDLIQSKLRGHLAENKYLIILDDLWTEDRHQWLKLEGFLTGGPRGSWIVVTTRSMITAEVVGGVTAYQLKGLSEKDSWELFLTAAFGEEHEQGIPSDLVQIGQEIVKRCVNVPLAILHVGYLLYGQTKEEWVSFKDVEIGRIQVGKNSGIMPILKLSYHHLDFALKVCFSYCAIFPKDHVMKKETLISLWMAQGYVKVEPLERGQTVEYAAEEYFSILLRRLFFQDVQKDESGEIVSCKMHDLMHDLAQEVAGKGIYATDSLTELDEKVRHLYHRASDEGAESSFPRTKIHTYLQERRKGQFRQALLRTDGLEVMTFNGMTFLMDPLPTEAEYTPHGVPVTELLANWTSVRALDLSNLCIKNLPSTLGNLLHLRYLDLSRNPIGSLPESITRLHNLQTLKLLQCTKLEELPKDLAKLVKLRILDISGCTGLNGMPRDLGKLSCLQKLTMFVLADTNRKSKQYVSDQLKELKALKNLKGHLDFHVKILENVKYATAERGRYLSEQHLSQISFQFPATAKDFQTIVDCEEALLEDLQPYRNLREWKLVGYSGKRMSSWAVGDNLATFLPNLVKITIENCNKLQHLPSLGKLQLLKSLQIMNSSGLEFAEDTTSSSSSNVTSSSGSVSFFPSLEKLKLEKLPKLKRWWRDDLTVDSNISIQQVYRLPSFPHLSSLDISGCPNLTCIPLCLSVERLDIRSCNEKLRVVLHTESGDSKIREVFTGDVRCLKSILPVKPFSFQSLELISIVGDEDAENLSEVGPVFQSCSSCLRSLEITGFSKLKSLDGGLEHLTALEKLRLCDLPDLNPTNDEMPWIRLHHSLRSLSLERIPKLVSLPDGIKYLTALQSLHLSYCEGLESVPESIRVLRSLQKLTVWNCSANLKERCRNPTGEDWPNIQHIPRIEVSAGFYYRDINPYPDKLTA